MKKEKINVRIVKKTTRKKPAFQKLEPSTKTKKPAHHLFDQKKKTKVIVAVAMVMVVIFIMWLSLLGGNLAREDSSEEQSFWGKIITNIKNEFNGVKESFDEAKTSLSNDSETLPDTELESDVFPETK